MLETKAAARVDRKHISVSRVQEMPQCHPGEAFLFAILIRGLQDYCVQRAVKSLLDTFSH